VKGSRIRVVIEASDLSAIRGAIGRAGGKTEASHARLVQALVLPEALEALANNPSSRYVRPPFLADADAVAGEDVGATGASVWQGAGRTGTGVKVAIVDLGFAGYTDRQVSGDLPGSLTTVDYCGGDLATATAHGTGVAEIVHEMAPDAQLYLICIDSDVTLGQAEEYAKANGIKIVNHSVSWFDTSRGDGSGGAGTPDAIVANARANGILWVNAAGNYAQRHWSGAFVDTDGDGFLNFASADEGETFYLWAGNTVCTALKWDSWPATSQDYDLDLADSASGTLRATSTTLQNGSQRPYEELCYTNDTGVDQFFFFAIYKFAATVQPRFDLYVFGDAAALQYQVAAGSVTEPGSSPSALAAGAICWQNNTLEPFSSRGPTIDRRIKPDISGQDDVSSATYGAFAGCSGDSGFFGTSAAAPHVAGAAALAAQSFPSYTPAQLQDFLAAAAKDLGAGGKDSSFGAGQLQLPPILAPTITGFTPSAGPVGTQVTITGTRLVSVASVKFNGVAAVTPNVVSAAQIKAVVPAGASSGPIQVITADGTGTSLASYKVTPRVTGFDPGSALRGASVEIDGFNFTGATRVVFGSAIASTFTVDSDTQITATVPATAISGKVTVTTPAGSGISTTSFLVILPPTVTGFTPAAGPVGTLVTVRGTSLDTVTAATLAGTDVGPLTHIGSTLLKFTVPPDATTGKIAVTNPAATNQSTGSFTVTLTIASFNPLSGSVGDTVAITGIGFSHASGVKFGDLEADFNIHSDTQIRAVVPPGATTAPITVGNGTFSLTTSSSFVVVPRLIVDLGTLAGTFCTASVGHTSSATALNAAGDVAGSSCVLAGFFQPVSHAVLWHNGASRDLGTVVPGNDRSPDQSVAYGMNDSDQVVGQDSLAGAFLWSNGTFATLGFSNALDISNDGVVVGVAISLLRSDSWSAVSYDSSGGEVTTLAGIGGTFRSEADAINDSGQIAGYASTTGDTAFHAVRWTGGLPQDLGTLGGTHSFGTSTRPGMWPATHTCLAIPAITLFSTAEDRCTTSVRLAAASATHTGSMTPERSSGPRNSRRWDTRVLLQRRRHARSQ
jgi:probable HAF family extracellular repeat protein